MREMTKKMIRIRSGINTKMIRIRINIMMIYLGAGSGSVKLL